MKEGKNYHSYKYSHSKKIHIKYRIKHLWHKIENSFVFMALASFFWLVYKSGTKPSRIVYPCQKAAAASLSTFVILAIVSSPLFIYMKKIRTFFTHDFKLNKLFLSIAIIAAIFGVFLAIDYYNTMPMNSPVESGINGKVLSTSEQVNLGTQCEYATIPAAYDLPSPHKVVTVHDSNSSTWEGEGNPNKYMNQTEIDKMVDVGIMELTGTTSPQDGWRKIIPYANGQSVAIKVNFNNNWYFSSSGFYYDDDSNTNMLNYAAVVNSVIRGLKSIGVPSDKIWITDPSRPVHDQFRDRIDDKGVQYYINQNCEAYIEGRPNVFVTGYVPDNSVYASTSTAYDEKIRPAQVFADATYIINMPQLKGHGFTSVGRVTLGLKNHFGSVYYTADALGDDPAHDADPFAKLLADINNNSVFRDKTRLVVGDGIMGNPNINYGSPTLWSSFGNKPPETLFFGVDPVAIDSVMVDYIRREVGPQATGIVQFYAANLGLGVSESWDDNENYTCIDYHPIDLDSQM
ncbi:hypothetical protein MSLAZ_1285 [Methanosarcina lacustris Z-7289]|uniref:DUF362 domain-containing protein n=1 Tax=Methanosarcina lacustris Z-7289 TaxID=1434111 RepID=A0A0E3S309_9EURY|nr:DUF362 domain-containing protein [Methanosarcina lacustris]AKB74546.1 hypothetical protein MSLAZ_1285 [Methanosarcina lacustris Z-7289]